MDVTSGFVIIHHFISKVLQFDVDRMFAGILLKESRQKIELSIFNCVPALCPAEQQITDNRTTARFD